MDQITRIKIEGFRRLAKFDLDLRPLMVMIGANGVGKTSILDAISFLSSSANGRLGDALSDLGGIASVLTRGVAKEFRVSVEGEIHGTDRMTYELTLAKLGAGFEIKSEELAQVKDGLDRPFTHLSVNHGNPRFYDGRFMSVPSWEYNGNETALSQVPWMFTLPFAFRRLTSSTAQYHVLDVGPRAPIKLPQAMRPATTPGLDGEYLLSFLYSLRESSRSRYEAITDALSAGFESFEELAFPVVAAGTLAMTWKDSSFKDPLFINELSEGTLRFLWLVSVLQSPSLPTITMIDEPEVSLHPELLCLLVDLMREASKRTQLIVATHSDRMVRFLHPNEVLVLDTNEEGLATATWADTLDLDRWLEDYSLDDVWRMGRIGGRS